MSDADFTFDKTMDLHNNARGRGYFASVAWTEKNCWLCETNVKAPSDDIIANALYTKAVSQSYQVFSQNQLSWYPYNLVYIQN